MKLSLEVKERQVTFLDKGREFSTTRQAVQEILKGCAIKVNTMKTQGTNKFTYTTGVISINKMTGASSYLSILTLNADD